jgi:hypothetical protein
LQVATKLAMIAAFLPPLRLPANSQFYSNREWSNCAFTAIVVDLRFAVYQETAQRSPIVQRM